MLCRGNGCMDGLGLCGFDSCVGEYMCEEGPARVRLGFSTCRSNGCINGFGLCGDLCVSEHMCERGRHMCERGQDAG